jgi:hypothetical protein
MEMSYLSNPIGTKNAGKMQSSYLDYRIGNA